VHTRVRSPHRAPLDAPAGFEGLTYDAHGKTLYALLQSAAWQDGGDNRTTSRYTRLLAYDVSTSGRAHERPTLVGEWVVPLPQDSKGSTLGSNEILFARKGVFLILSRDGNGRGGDDPTSLYKCVHVESFLFLWVFIGFVVAGRQTCSTSPVLRISMGPSLTTRLASSQLVACLMRASRQRSMCRSSTTSIACSWRDSGCTMVPGPVSSAVAE
jgi:hypothetical protein